MKRPIGVVMAAVGLLAAGAMLAAAPTPKPAAISEVTPGVSMSLGGSSGGGSTSSVVLSTHDWYEALLYAGEASDHNFCTGGLTGPYIQRAVLPDGTRPLVTWRVAARLRAFDGATAMIDFRWQREVASGDLSPSTDFEGQFTWQATEGSRRVLDFVRQTPPAALGCDTQTLELRYIAPGPDELGEAAIGYDIWLLQRLPSEERRTLHLHTTGEQGAAVSFAFPTTGLALPRSTGPSPKMFDVRTTGSIAGRVRRDGRIDLAVDAGRIAMPSGGGLGSGSSGRTRLTVAENETVELEPPPLFGDNRDAPYTDVVGDARTAIRVRARRLW